MDSLKQSRKISVATDMGNGGTYCEECSYSLNQGDCSLDVIRQVIKMDKCPNCNATFIDSLDYFSNTGGSDF